MQTKHPFVRRVAHVSVFPCFQSGSCSISHALQSFNAGAGGTATLKCHTQRHTVKNKQGGELSLVRKLDSSLKSKIKYSAALAVAIDLLPLNFADNRDGMIDYTTAVFRAGQNKGISDDVDIADFQPSAGAVRSAVTEIAKLMREEFKTSVLEGDALMAGGSMTSDGVTLQLKDKHFHDLTIIFFEFETSGKLLNPVSVRMVYRTLTLVEPLNGETAANLRLLLSTNSQQRYETLFTEMAERFTFVTDCAAVMPNVVGASVSQRMAPLREKWMDCFAHQTNTAMKLCLEECENDSLLQDVFNDLKSAKTLVRIFKKAGLNQRLGDEYNLIQEVETRFSSTYQVAKRFIKSGQKALELGLAHDSTANHDAMHSLKVTRDARHNVVGFPALEAILDAFEVIVEAQKVPEASETPKIHLTFPRLHMCLEELSRTINGSMVYRSGLDVRVVPSDYSKRLCAAMLRYLNEKVVVHDLWIAACILHPYYSMRSRYSSRGMTLIQKLMDSVGNDLNRAGVSENDDCGKVSLFQEHGTAGHRNDNNCGQFGEPAVGNLSGSSPKRAKFSLNAFADSHFVSSAPVSTDDLSLHLSKEVSTFNFDREDFLNNEFSVVLFWHKQQSKFPVFSTVARRIFAILVSSCATERVFSALKRVVTHDRSRLRYDILEDIIVMQSALSEAKRTVST